MGVALLRAGTDCLPHLQASVPMLVEKVPAGQRVQASRREAPPTQSARGRRGAKLGRSGHGKVCAVYMMTLACICTKACQCCLLL